MKNTVLVFPNSMSMMDFLLIYRMKGITANHSDITISGRMSNNLVTTALIEYGAEIMNKV